MDAALKYKIVEKIIKSNDDAVLNQIKLLLKIQDQDFWPDLPNPLKQRIDTAKKELDNGLGISHDEVMDELNRLIH
jgi:hypothetical protein